MQRISLKVSFSCDLVQVNSGENKSVTLEICTFSLPVGFLEAVVSQSYLLWEENQKQCRALHQASAVRTG